MNPLQALENAIKAVLRDFGGLFHQDAQAVLGRISADIQLGTLALTRATGDKLHTVGEALNAPVSQSAPLVQTPAPAVERTPPKPAPAKGPAPTPAE